MSQKHTLCFNSLLESGHTFDHNEILLKFQYRVLNMILVVSGVFSFIFAIASLLDINPLGTIHTGVNLVYALSCMLLMIRLRGPKERYLQNACLMYSASLATFTSALIFVPSDEFRIIWFYLVVFAAYITGGVRSGDLVTAIAVVLIFTMNALFELHLSETAIFSAVLGLVIASLLIRSHTKKVTDFEDEVTAHHNKLTRFNEELEAQVARKTEELRDLNESLENKVKEKVAQITKQEELMITQSRLAAMGEMMSMIAHQWRQPLATTTLMITNERIKSMMAGEERRESDKILDKISDTMVYLSDTIDDFQTYFKPNRCTEERVICELIERVQNFIEPRVRHANVRMHLQGCPEDIRIDTYANEVVQVLINLVNNSIDALLQKREGSRDIWLDVRETEQSAIITVQDNGGGIDEKIIQRIFEPYFSTKSKNGTGLGLYMVKMIVDKHICGSIDVANTEEGACFTFVIPKKIGEGLCIKE